MPGRSANHVRTDVLRTGSTQDTGHCDSVFGAFFPVRITMRNASIALRCPATMAQSPIGLCGYASLPRIFCPTSTASLYVIYACTLRVKQRLISPGVKRTLARLLTHLREEGHEAMILGPESGMYVPDFPLLFWLTATCTAPRTSYEGRLPFDTAERRGNTERSLHCVDRPRSCRNLRPPALLLPGAEPQLLPAPLSAQSSGVRARCDTLRTLLPAHSHQSLLG